MEPVYAKVSSKGQLVIPVEMREALGIEPGTRIAIRQDGDELILRPDTATLARRIIHELCGITAGGPSMTDELLAERRSEDEKAGW
jgi:AbrB family looped-hinge helix DNA binding protein